MDKIISMLVRDRDEANAEVAHLKRVCDEAQLEAKKLRAELEENEGVIAAWRRRTNEVEDEVERLREVLHKTAEDLEIEHPSYIQEMVGNKLLAGIIRKALEDGR